MQRHGRRFAYHLALELGRANVDAMLREMTSDQFAEWMAFFEIAPFGKPAEDARLAKLQAVVANFSPKFAKSDWKATDFLPPLPEEEKTKVLSAKILATFKQLGDQRGKTK